MGWADHIAVVEAVYDLQGGVEEWLGRIQSATQPLLDRGLGISVHTFEMGPERMVVPAMVSAGVPDAVMREATRWLTETPPGLHRVIHYQTGSVASLSEALGPAGIGEDSQFHALRADHGITDVLGVKALNPDGAGVTINIPSPRFEVTSREFRDTWSHVAAHLAAGYRLRRALPDEPALALRDNDAVVNPDGTVAHAAGDARAAGAREALREAARRLDRARTRSGRSDPEALALWRGLVDGRWSLVDRFDHDGKRLLVARENEPDVRDPRALTVRERQVAAYAALGQSNKLIAYTLGVSVSTVVNQLHRAIGKLGVGSRLELVKLFHAELS